MRFLLPAIIYVIYQLFIKIVIKIMIIYHDYYIQSDNSRTLVIIFLIMFLFQNNILEKYCCSKIFKSVILVTGTAINAFIFIYIFDRISVEFPTLKL